MIWIVVYVVMAMMAAGILAYRGDNDFGGGQAISIFFAAPLALAYQTGSLIRERQKHY